MGVVSVNGTELYYERHGSGHPVVLCHGDGLDSRTWMPQVRALANQYEVIIYDLNGFGRSGGSDRDQLSFDIHTEDLRGLIEALDLTRPTVVGWSMGGRVAYTLAARYPDILTALVLLEPASRDKSGSLPTRVFLSAVARLASVVGWPRVFMLRLRIAGLRGQPMSYPNTTVEGLNITKIEYYVDAISQIDTEEYNKMITGMNREKDVEGTPSVEWSSIRVPTLGVDAVDSPESYSERVATLTAEAPNARRETIPEAGHAAHMDNSTAFNQVLEEFLETV